MYVTSIIVRMEIVPDALSKSFKIELIDVRLRLLRI